MTYTRHVKLSIKRGIKEKLIKFPNWRMQYVTFLQMPDPIMPNNSIQVDIVMLAVVIVSVATL